jgi:hypothetical protein
MHQAYNHRKPPLAASAAGRLNSNPDEPEPPFSKRLTSLKLSDDGQCALRLWLIRDMASSGLNRQVVYIVTALYCCGGQEQFLLVNVVDDPPVRVPLNSQFQNGLSVLRHAGEI